MKTRFSTSLGRLPLALLLSLGLPANSHAAEVLVNGDFEAGVVNGVPEGWTNVVGTAYVSPDGTGRRIPWQVFMTPLNQYPPLDAYAGAQSLGVCRTDGVRAVPVGQGLDFYYFNVLYQTIPVQSATRYYVKVGAAAFVHHNRMDDLDDWWGAGVALRICPGIGVYTDARAVWQHNFWNGEGDSFWRHGPVLENQLSVNDNPLPNSFLTSASQTHITFSILWMTKWDSYMDLAAIDSIQLDLSTNGPAPLPVKEFTAKDPPTWTSPDPIWTPDDRLLDWTKPGAVGGGDQFQAPQELTVGLHPVGAATGDLNGDGRLDFAVAGMKGHLVSVFLQQSNGAFVLGAHLPGAIGPRGVQIGQVVGDAALDLVASSPGRREVLIYPGRGDGSFADPLHVPVATTKQLGALALGDFDQDGKTDFAVAAMQPGSSSDAFVFRGDGLGAFTQSQKLANLSDPQVILAADFGGSTTPARPDGRLDLAIQSWGGTTYCYLGLGDGTFRLVQTVDSAGAWKSTGLAMANLNEDPQGLPDLVVTYMWGPGDSADHAQVLTGRGNGTFITQARLEDWLFVTRFPSGVDALDFNHDGHPDLAFANFGSPDGVVLQNNGIAGRYSFREVVRFGVGARNTSVVARDLDRDGSTDLLVTGAGCQTVSVIHGGPGVNLRAPSFHGLGGGDAIAVGGFVDPTARRDIAMSSDTVRVFRNDGQMRFTRVYSFNLAGGTADLRAADLDVDGKEDLAVLRSRTSAASDVVVLLAGGTSQFTAAVYPATGARQARSLLIADCDASRGPDLVVSEAQRGSEGIYLLLNNGAGGFEAPQRTPLPVDSQPGELAAGDFNGDKNLDLVVVLSGTNRFAFLAGQGNGGWADPVLFLAGVQPSGIGAADFNGDGKLDVAVSHAGEDNVSVFLGDGGGAFATGLTIAVGSHPTHLLVHDFNADAQADMAVANTGDRTLSFLRGKGDGTFEPVQTYRTSASPTRMAAGDLSGSGYLDLVVGPDGEVFRNSLNPGVYLSVTPAGNDLVFTWPALATGYSLISSERLGPAAVWAPVPTPPITDGDLNKVVVARPGAETFYRLRK
jgi:hypothetical protein